MRADSGLEIGTGHVMRCLTLSHALRDSGAKPVFVTRAHRGHLIPTITARGFQVETLPPGDIGATYGPHPAPPEHAPWLEANWREDAAATRAVLEAEGADWLVMDHYALDKSWQEAALPPGVRLLVLDDLADRPHLADVLLDQNAGREASDYDGLVPQGCDLRIGPAFALLRPEFARLRPTSLARRESLKRPAELLITLGGIDKDNAMGRVLESLDGMAIMEGMRISVVMGQSAPWLTEVQAHATRMSVPTEVAAGVPDMAERMTRADLCIGAAGSTAWERCALGLPTLQVVLASNQEQAARHMADQGVTLALPFPNALNFTSILEQGLVQLAHVDAYRAMSRRAAALTDGAGAAHLANRLLEIPDAH